MQKKDKAMNLRMICIALLTFPVAALACVDTRSGSFCTQYTDITQSGDHKLNLTRTYNSRSSEIGWFGHGWGTPFEARLVVMPDGSVVVQDPSTQRNKRYASHGNDGQQAGVERIVAVAIEKEGLGVEAASALRSRLFLNEELRRAMVLRYGIQTQLPVGTKLHSTECSQALVTRTINEYQHITCSKDIDYFDLAGRLVRHEDGVYRFVIHYEGGHPDTIEDTLGHKLNLKWTTTGHVAEARANQDAPIITYRYDEQDNLVFSSEAEGNDSRYTYDIRHKLTEIGHTDETHTDMQYDDAGRIIAVNDPYSPQISYTYRHDPEYPSLHHWTTATTTGADGKQTIRVAEYFSTLDNAGVERLSRVVKTDTLGKEEIVLDDKERIMRIGRPDGSFSEFAYHPTLGKVAAISTNEVRTDFSYDKQGNLIRASTGKGHLVSLDYDRRNNIIRMVESDKAKHVRRELTFKYNAQKKPIKISMVGKGKINVEYDQQGEITKVDSKQGAKMAIEVIQAFDALLKLVKVAGANYCL